MRAILELMQARRSSRMPFDPDRRIPPQDLRRILEAARWAPTAHNMQNFQIIVVDDKALLETIGRISEAPTEIFLRENYAQLSFSEAELLRKKTGLLASMFPPSWLRPGSMPTEAPAGGVMQPCAALLLVIYDARKRAPASEGDMLGMMSLGCVMQNIWLMAEARGIGMQILSAFSAPDAESELRFLLAIPGEIRIAFACRLGYPSAAASEHLRVRRDIEDAVHLNRYGAKFA